MRVLLACALLWSFPLADTQTTSKFSRPEQTHFSAEREAVEHPIEIPEGVLAIISKSDLVRDTLASEGTSQLPKDWLTASEIHLAGPDERDIVVIAGGFLRGANITTFWLFRPTSHGYEMLLEAPVHDLIVKNSRSNGYRAIELLSAAAVKVSTVVMKFDGKKYQVYKGKPEPIR